MQSDLLPLYEAISPNDDIVNAFNGLHSVLLISLVQLCNDKCVAIMDNKKINFVKTNKNLERPTKSSRGSLGYNYLKVTLPPGACYNNKFQDENRSNPISTWFLFQSHNKKMTL